MDRLIAELTASGTLDSAGVQWAQAYQAEHGGELDAVLLDLELVHEADLLKALGNRFGLSPAAPEDLTDIDPAVGQSLPLSFSKSFFMCPVRASGNDLVALVRSPLVAENVAELRDLFGIEVQQRVAPSHHLEVARERVYGVAVSPRTQKLEERLQRHRAAPDVNRVLGRLARAASFADAIVEMFEFAQCSVESSCFLVDRDSALHCVVYRDGSTRAAAIGAPNPACTLAPAVIHGGYFLGPVAGTEADREFFASIERDVPRWAFVSPVPAAGEGKVVFCADNGARGIPTRWVAELTLLAARVGQRGAEERAAAPAEPVAVAPAAGVIASPLADAPGSEPPPAISEPAPQPDPPAAPAEPAVSEADQRVLERLRGAAAVAGVSVERFVDELLREREAPTVPRPAPEASAVATAAVVTEVKGLFEKLATDIPTQLARGMESAFRDLVPRLGTPAAGAPPAAAAPRPSAAAAVELVQKAPAKREVSNYRAKRRKAARVKL